MQVPAAQQQVTGTEFDAETEALRARTQRGDGAEVLQIMGDGAGDSRAAQGSEQYDEVEQGAERVGVTDSVLTGVGGQVAPAVVAQTPSGPGS